ncbi:MAG: 30S ribosomal protein S17 [Candidatus Liptonbacteria bacterium]|nr:30S ribosomal protein S17 [Candidatus Liptonbacteria bacterium]
MKNNIKKKRKLEGIVVSDKMQKTVVIEINRFKIDKKYQKHFKVRKRLKAHDENDEYKVGDKVTIEETRPLSKDKRWRVVSSLKI